MARSTLGRRDAAISSHTSAAVFLFLVATRCVQSGVVTETSSSTLDVISGEGNEPLSLVSSEEHESNVVNQTNADDPLQQVLGKECRGSYSPFCLKLGLMKLVERGSGITLGLWPGVSVSAGRVPPAPPAYLLADPDKADALLLDRMSEYFSSLSVNVKILDKSAPLKFAKAYLGTNAASARRRKYGGALTAAGLMSGGTLLAAGMAALAAMAGKAMMASMLALMLAALAALKGGGGGGGGEKTTYEIVAKPVVSHLHSHSSEVQHGGHGHYRRSFNGQDKAYSGQKPQQQSMTADTSDAVMSETDPESYWVPKNPDPVAIDRS